MKKFFVFILIVAMFASVFAFAGCVNEGKGSDSYTLVAPDGAPALAIANLSDKIDTDAKSYSIDKSIVASTQIGTEALKNDLAIVPANLAAKLYNGGNDIRLLAVVTNGNLFLMSSIESSIESLEDIKGKMVYSIGQGSVPDMIFQSLLKQNNIEYSQGENAVENKVTIKYCADGSEVISQMALAKKSGNLVYGMLAEPAVTMAKGKGFYEVFDMQTMWGENTQNSTYSGYAQAVLIAKSSVCNDKEFINKLIDAIDNNAKSVEENPQKAVENIKAIYPQTSLQSTISQDVIKRCNIKTIAMSQGKAYYEEMLKAVMSINAGIVGGKLPDDNLYYIG